MDTLLKGCALLLLFLIALIAIAPFTHAPQTNTEKSRPAMSNVLSTTCPLSTVEALIQSQQLSRINTGRSPQCMEIGVADRLWLNMDQKDRQGLVLAVECAVSADDKHVPCLKLYSQSSGRLFGSAEMGKVTIAR
jgi:hypothetical protein